MSVNAALFRAPVEKARAQARSLGGSVAGTGANVKMEEVADID
jgi:hypothetical protein